MFLCFFASVMARYIDVDNDTLLIACSFIEYGRQQYNGGRKDADRRLQNVSHSVYEPPADSRRMAWSRKQRGRRRNRSVCPMEKWRKAGSTRKSQRTAQGFSVQIYRPFRMLNLTRLAHSSAIKIRTDARKIRARPS